MDTITIVSTRLKCSEILICLLLCWKNFSEVMDRKLSHFKEFLNK